MIPNIIRIALGIALKIKCYVKSYARRYVKRYEHFKRTLEQYNTGKNI